MPPVFNLSPILRWLHKVMMGELSPVYVKVLQKSLPLKLIIQLIELSPMLSIK